MTIKLLLEKENNEKWHARGIHWMMDHNHLHFISIMMNFNPATYGQMCQPNMMMMNMPGMNPNF